MPIKKIAVIMAMLDEAQPLIERLALHKKPGVFPAQVPMEVFVGKLGDLELYVIWNGKDPWHQVDNIGTQPATLAAYLAITELQPDLVISAGTAGGFTKRGAALGDIYLSSGVFRYHDRRIPYMNFPAYGLGSYPSADVSAVARDLNLKLGAVSTGNSLETIERDSEIIASCQAAAKEMEVAAIAWVCQMFGTPVFALKAIVNLVDGGDKPSHEQFSEHLHAGSAKLQHALVDVLTYCAGKTVQELAS